MRSQNILVYYILFIITVFSLFFNNYFLLFAFFRFTATLLLVLLDRLKNGSIVCRLVHINLLIWLESGRGSPRMITGIVDSLNIGISTNTAMRLRCTELKGGRGGQFCKIIQIFEIHMQVGTQKWKVNTYLLGVLDILFDTKSLILFGLCLLNEYERYDFTKSGDVT